MNPERWRRIEEIFGTVAGRPTAERESYLTRVCGDDEELRREVISLLACGTADEFLQDPIKRAALSLTAEPQDDLTGQRIGAYRVTRLIGRGGMGAVYVAVRDDRQFHQQVAIKIIKRGMDTDFVRGRFLRERQILAGLEHPHIARLFDGGATPDGLPYFAMEFVEGEPITEYCRHHQLSLNDKLKLFRDVCSAVQHAHQKLVVHRDLKPGNILVNPDGGPKLLDFGIAKLLAPDPSEAVKPTETVRMMTPDYASPEQVRGQLITTATDIYTLGVLLYELVTGSHPYQFKTYSPVEIEHVICEAETEKPSQAVIRMTSAPARLVRQLAGDLDNIVLMAMRKEPERRYQSVEQFSEDIRRYLEGRPVIARPDTFVYRASKFINRHKAALAAVLLVVLSLLGGLIATNHQARRAERRFQQVRRLANTFLFDFHDKLQTLPGTTEAREMVVRTAIEYLDSLAQEAAGDPALEWELAVAYQKVGDVQGNPWASNLGRHQEAMKSYQKSLRLAGKLAASDSADLKVLRVLSDGYFKLGALQSETGDKTAANELLRQAVAAAESLERQSRELNDLVQVQNCYVRLGDTQLDTGDPASALESYRHSLRLSERRVAEHPGDRSQTSLAMSHCWVGEALASTGDLAGALASYRQSLSIVEELLRKQPSDQFNRRNLMITYFWLGHLSGNPRFINQGDEEAALQYYGDALAIAEERLAIDPKNARAQLDLVNSCMYLAGVLTRADPLLGAQYYRKALSINRDLLQPAPEEFMYLRREASCLNGLATALGKLGNRQGALQNLRQSLRLLQSLSDKDPANTPVQADLHAALIALADLSLEIGDNAGALEHYRQALARAESAMAGQVSDAYAMWRLADSYAGLGQYYATLGSNVKAPIAGRLANWREARVWREKALGVWDGWSRRAVSSVFNTTRREGAARAVAECDTVLKRLATPQQR